MASSVAAAADFSFQGTFNQDDDVQMFNFSIGADSTVTLRSLGYAGGLNSAGQLVLRGGFDTTLALFDGSGTLIDGNSDGGPGNVGTDAGTGQAWDTFLQTPLAAGDYQVSITEFNNAAIGPNLSDGFTLAGTGNFTAAFGCGAPSFCDVSGVTPFDQRNNHWAFDIQNVLSASAVGAVTAVPEPGSYAMLLAGLGLLGFVSRRKARVG
jgi:hypothetical protein